MKNTKIIELIPFQYENLSITTSAVVNLSTEYTNIAKEAFITIENNDVRMRIDGGDPSSTLGHLISASTNQSAYLGNKAAIKSCSMITDPLKLLCLLGIFVRLRL